MRSKQLFHFSIQGKPSLCKLLELPLEPFSKHPIMREKQRISLNEKQSKSRFYVAALSRRYSRLGSNCSS